MISFFRKRIFLAIFLLIYFVIALLTYKDFGSSLDEQHVYLRGKLFYNKVRGNDQILQKDFVIPSGNNLHLYNNLYASFLYAINDSESLEQYHLLNFIFASLIFVTMFELLLAHTGRGGYAIIGPIFLLFTPRLFGDIPANPKDIPLAIYYLLSLLLIYRYSHHKIKNVLLNKFILLLMGVSFGLTASQRIIGYSVYLVFILYSSLIIVKSKDNKLQLFLNLVVDLSIIFLIGFLIHIISMPYLGADPYNNFISLLKSSKSFQWGGSILFFGKEFSENNIPRMYIPVWIMISTPIFIILLSILGFFYRTMKSDLIILITISFSINLFFFIGLKPVVYDGLRHALYLLPHIVIFASVSFINMMQYSSKKIKIFILITVLFSLIKLVFSYLSMHPYQSIYFNSFLGNLQSYRFQFETDYWGLSAKETAYFFLKNFSNNELRNKTVGVYGNVYVFEYYTQKLQLPLNVLPYEDNKKYDFVTCWDRWRGCKYVQGKLIGAVSRNGLILNSIYKTSK